MADEDGRVVHETLGGGLLIVATRKVNFRLPVDLDKEIQDFQRRWELATGTPVTLTVMAIAGLKKELEYRLTVLGRIEAGKPDESDDAGGSGSAVGSG